MQPFLQAEIRGACSNEQFVLEQGESTLRLAGEARMLVLNGSLFTVKASVKKGRQMRFHICLPRALQIKRGVRNYEKTNLLMPFSGVFSK